LDARLNRIPLPRLPILSCPEMFPSLARFQRASNRPHVSEAPQFIELKLSARQIPHFPVQQSCAALCNTHAKPHNRVAVNAGHPLNLADSRAFR
jgi:hypothetical protein